MSFRPAKDYIVSLCLSYPTPGTKGAEVRLPNTNDLVGYTWVGAGGVQLWDSVCWSYCLSLLSFNLVFTHTHSQVESHCGPGWPSATFPACSSPGPCIYWGEDVTWAVFLRLQMKLSGACLASMHEAMCLTSWHNPETNRKLELPNSKCLFCAQESEARLLWNPGQPELHNEILLQEGRGVLRGEKKLRKILI